mgnify:CR=1 FL=1
MTAEPSTSAPDLLSRQENGVLHLTINREARRNAIWRATAVQLVDSQNCPEQSPLARGRGQLVPAWQLKL